MRARNSRTPKRSSLALRLRVSSSSTGAAGCELEAPKRAARAFRVSSSFIDVCQIDKRLKAD